MKTFSKGDEVKWNTPQGETRGTVVKVIKEDTQKDGQTFTASSDQPRYEVESSTTGKTAIHKAESLTKA